jgi:DNA-binding Xre family transcriptional regulator
MGGKANKSQRQAYEARASAQGNRMVTVRLNPAAARNLEAICKEFECTPRDVIERLLLGAAHEPAPAAQIKAWSRSEQRIADELGLELA